MIVAYTGLPGTGKTYGMVRDAVDYIAGNKRRIKKGLPPRKLFANFHMEGAEYFKELSELKYEQNALILLDEASIYIPAQEWRKMPLEFVRQMRQSRHAGIDLWYTAQHFNDVPTALRRLTQYEKKCSRLWKMFVVNTVCPHNKSDRFGKDFYMIDKFICDKYDTHENIEFSDVLNMR